MMAIPLEKARAEINEVFEQDFFNCYCRYRQLPRICTQALVQEMSVMPE
jgi:hypothetical protein